MLRVMLVNAIFINITVISWRSVLMVEEPYFTDKANNLLQVTGIRYDLMLYRVYLAMNGVRAQNCFGDRHCLFR